MRLHLSTLFIALLVLSLAACEEHISQPVADEQAALQTEAARGSADLAGADAVALAKRGPVLNFVAPLSGREEVPVVDSDGTGVAKLKLIKGDMSLDYKLIAANIDGVTQAHIHCGTPGVNGPVVAFLFGFNAEGVSPTGILAEGTITPEDVIPRPDSEACPGGVANFSDLVDKLTGGGAYVNVHTLANPPGEIRGHVGHGNGPAR